MKVEIAETVGVLVLVTAAGINWWAVPHFTGKSYLDWYLNAGPFVALALSAISISWDEPDKNLGLISSNPLEYSGTCLQAAAIPLLAIGGHARKEQQPNGLSALDSVTYIFAMIVFVAAVIAWLLLIAPLHYFVVLVCGAPSRAAQTSTYVLFARIHNRGLDIKEGKVGENTPDGYWNASMRNKPVALTNAFGAAILYASKGLIGV